MVIMPARAMSIVLKIVVNFFIAVMFFIVNNLIFCKGKQYSAMFAKGNAYFDIGIFLLS